MSARPPVGSLAVAAAGDADSCLPGVLRDQQPGSPAIPQDVRLVKVPVSFKAKVPQQEEQGGLRVRIEGHQ